MNDANFIIISSDEETNTKTEEVPDNIKGNVKLAEVGCGSSKNQYSIIGSAKKEKAQCSQIPIIDGINKCLPKSCDCGISEESECATGDSEMLKELKCGKIISEVESEDNKNIENDNTVEMSHTFNKFLQLVLSMEEKENDKAKLLKKITKYHNLADVKYLKSAEFNNLLENSICKLMEDHSFLYFVIKEVLDCLLSKRLLQECKQRRKRKLSDAGGHDKREKFEECCYTKEVDGVPVGDLKHLKTINKLTKVLTKLEKKIKELEEAEVDLSDEEDSVYLKMQRYRERYCQIYKKLCTYTKHTGSAKLAYTRKIIFNGTNNLQLDRAIESWLNKTMQFPDYASVLKFLGESNDNLNLRMSKEKIKKLAADVFVKIGTSLQLRRKYDLWDSLNSLLDNKVDPSASDAALREQLDSNFEIAAKKEKEILNYYADLQEQSSAKPTEVPDEEANDSPLESGDDVENEIEAVENELNSKISVEMCGYDDESDDEQIYAEKCSSPVTTGDEDDDKPVNAESTVSDASSNPGCVANRLDKDKNEESREHPEQRTEADRTLCPNFRGNVTGSVGIDNGKDGKNDAGTVLKVKILPDLENGKCLKKGKLKEREKFEEDSDCELVVLLSDEETTFNSEKDDKDLKMRKVHQINYAFINNNFNHNAMLTADDVLVKRRNTFKLSCKSGKAAQRRSLPLPLSELTNIKHITNKYAGFRSAAEKRKFYESIRVHPFESSRFRTSKLILPQLRADRCALHNGSHTKNVKSENECERTSEKDSCDPRETSNGEAIGPTNYGGSAGGNGDDNNEKKGNRKPSDQGKGLNENQEMEDDEGDVDDEKEDTERYATHETPFETDANRPECGHFETQTKYGSFASSPPHSHNVTIKRGQCKRNSVNAKAKRNENMRMSLQRNGGLANTTAYLSKKYPFGCKPYAGNARTERRTPEQLFPSKFFRDGISGAQEKMKSTPAKIAKSDEEIVKNFLEHSPSSISITSPRKSMKNKHSPSTFEAIRTLSRLKNITTTVVKASRPEKEKDVVVVGESSRNSPNQINYGAKQKVFTPKSGRNQHFLLPKIVMVEGNVSGFESIDTDNGITNFPDDEAPRPSRLGESPTEDGGGDDGNDTPPISTSMRKPPNNVEYVLLD